MRFGILGPVRATDVPLGGVRLRALLAMLLLDAGRVVPVERLIDGLYGEQPPAGAVNAVQSQVSRLRSALPVEFDGAGYRLAVEPDEVDAHRFARLAAAGHDALVGGDPAGAAAMLTEGLELWRGEALADVRAAAFAEAAAHRLGELRRVAVEDRIAARLRLGAARAAVNELRGLVAEEPLRERAWALLVRALAADGRPAEALAAYEQARQALADELGADPSAELSAAHLEVLRGPARRTVPAQLTTFVGRTDELRQVSAALATGRLVTLHGPGGSGKTRLAVETAGRHDGEVHVVELAAATGGDLASVVGEALGLREAGLRDRDVRATGRPGVTDRLVAALATRPMLLVLDNCEHVIGPAAALAGRLLAGCPELRILATSREPLGLTGEALCPVGGLPEPAAMRLFAERAAQATPGFALTDATTDAVRGVCATLDGLPLALELAAARLHALPVDELARRVDDRFRLLSRGSRTAPDRHRTLRAVVEWSWDLLGEPERVLARRFAVFRGGATLAAAEQVCGLGPDTVDRLTDLVGKSLIERDGDRYRMLATIHAFCAERLDEAGEREATRAAHAAYFLAVAREADAGLRGPGQLTQLVRLDADRDNLHAALRNADTATGLRLLAALSFYWWLRGLRAEAAGLAAELMGRPDAATLDGLGEEYALGALTAGLTGDVVVGDLAHRHLAAMTGPPAQPFLLYLSAITAGPPATGPDGLLLEQLRSDPWSEALGRIGAGWMVLLFAGSAADAEEHFAASLAVFRRLGERWGTMLALSGLAEVAIWRGDPGAAQQQMDAASRLADELESAVDRADLLRSRAESRLAAGDPAGAADDFRRTIELARDCGALELSAVARLGLGRLALQRGEHAEARRWSSAALAECPVGWYSAYGIRMAILAALGRIAEAEGDDAEADRRYREVFEVGTGLDGSRPRAEAVAGLAGIAVRAGRAEDAAMLLGAAEALIDQGQGGVLDGATEAVRATLGEAAYRRAHDRGAALDRAGARALTGRQPSVRGRSAPG